MGGVAGLVLSSPLALAWVVVDGGTLWVGMAIVLALHQDIDLVRSRNIRDGLPGSAASQHSPFGAMRQKEREVMAARFGLGWP